MNRARFRSRESNRIQFSLGWCEWPRKERRPTKQAERSERTKSSFNHAPLRGRGRFGAGSGALGISACLCVPLRELLPASADRAEALEKLQMIGQQLTRGQHKCAQNDRDQQ